jgi:hypothetical protein
MKIPNDHANDWVALAKIQSVLGEPKNRPNARVVLARINATLLIKTLDVLVKILESQSHYFDLKQLLPVDCQAGENKNKCLTVLG